MRRPNIKLTMIGIFVTLTLMMAAFAATSILSLTQVHNSNDALSQQWLPAIQSARDIELAMEKTRVAYGGHLAASTGLEKSTAEEQIKKAADAFNAAVERYKPYAMTERDKKLVELVGKAYAQYSTFGANMVELSNKGDLVMASSVFSRNMKMVSGIAANSIAEMVKTKTLGASTAISDSAHAYDLAVKIVAALISIVVVVVGAATIYVTRGITNPIQRLTLAMANLAQGHIHTIVPLEGRRDELGEMAAAVAVFKDALLSTKTMEAEAESMRIRAEEQRMETQAKAESDATARLEMATSGLAKGLKRLASGDLSFQLDETFSAEFEALRHDFNASVRQLRDTLFDIAKGVTTIDTSSREISKGADDLSRRTEQQAASLEQTAAALDEITVNVSNSAKRSNDARAVAQQANETAVRSAQVVSNAVDAMGRIEEASSKIANIIGVIDEIAFQTNLLALNAGVEAARAGDAGKGFAVVAQEVRELAQRSANAAKEIKGLIQRSSDEVQGGVKLVGETGDVLRSIESYIVTINEHMEAIALSAREQSTGLGEVNSAVNQMDQVTQSNAAMVEETSAASLSLADEVSHLRQTIGRFSLDAKGDRSGASGKHENVAEPVRTQPKIARAPEIRRISAPASNLAQKIDTWEEF